jgi:hypothetical protein
VGRRRRVGRTTASIGAARAGGAVGCADGVKRGWALGAAGTVDDTCEAAPVYLAAALFDEQMESPTVRVEVSGGTVGTDIPLVPGGAQHMRVMRHWISLQQHEHLVAWSTQDAALVQLGDISAAICAIPLHYAGP